MLKRGEKGYARIARNGSAGEPLPVLKGKADTDAVVYSDGFKTCDGLVCYGYKKRYRVKHGENRFADGRDRINGIESFRGLREARLAKRRGVHKRAFRLRVKEREFGYDYRNRNSYPILLDELRKLPLN